MVSRERRKSPRRQPQPSEPVSRVRVRAGRELGVLDISEAGVLVEGDTRLLPGTHVEIHIVTTGGRRLVRSRITRAFVAALSSDRVLYRGALAFDHVVELASRSCASDEGGNTIPDRPTAPSSAQGTPYPQHTP